MFFRRKILYFLTWLLLSGLLLSCAEEVVKPVKKDLVQQENQYAKGFSIEKIKEGVHRAEIKSEDGKTIKTFYTKHDSVKFKAPKGEWVLSVPIERVACQSTTHTSFFNALDCLDKVKGVGYGQLVQSGPLKTKMDQGEIINLTTAEEIDFELLIGIEPELLLIYPFGEGSFDKFENAGVPTIPISEYQEKTPLGQAEWIRLFGLLNGKEKEADSIFNVLSNRYQKFSRFVEKEINSSKRPTVITGSYWKGNWKTPSANTLIAQYINDAGAEYLIKDTSSVGNIEMDFESFFVKAVDADYFGKIFYDNDVVTKDVLIENDERMKVIKSYQTDDFFYCPSLHTNYFVNSAMEPDLVLMDLIYIFHPQCMPNHVPRYFRALESEE